MPVQMPSSPSNIRRYRPSDQSEWLLFSRISPRSTPITRWASKRSNTPSSTGSASNYALPPAPRSTQNPHRLLASLPVADGYPGYRAGGTGLNPPRGQAAKSFQSKALHLSPASSIFCSIAPLISPGIKILVKIPSRGRGNPAFSRSTAFVQVLRAQHTGPAADCYSWSTPDLDPAEEPPRRP